MPKVTMFFNQQVLKLSKRDIKAIGINVRPLVAEAMSTKETTFNPKTAIDFLPQEYHEGALVDGLISFEIETAGKPDRIEKLSVEVVTKLRNDLVVVLQQIPAFGRDFNPRQLIWIKYADPRGPHV